MCDCNHNATIVIVVVSIVFVARGRSLEGCHRGIGQGRGRTALQQLRARSCCNTPNASRAFYREQLFLFLLTGRVECASVQPNAPKCPTIYLCIPIGLHYSSRTEATTKPKALIRLASGGSGGGGGTSSQKESSLQKQASFVSQSVWALASPRQRPARTPSRHSR